MVSKMNKRNMTPAAVALLYTMAVHIEEGKRWRLRIDTLCEESGLGRRTVVRALASLAEAGIVEETRTGRSSFFALHLDLDVEVQVDQCQTGASCADGTTEDEGKMRQTGQNDAPVWPVRSASLAHPLKGTFQRPPQAHEVCVNPVVVDRAREPEPTHKPETYLEAFARRMRAEQARQAEELAQYLAENPEPPPPPPAPPPAPYGGGDRRAADDGWGPVDQTPAKPEPAKHELADIPELEELVNASKPAKLRRLSLGDVEARALVELVEKHGAEAVRAALLGLAGEYERPLQPVRKHLEAAAAAPAIPRHPNGQPRWVVERDGYKRMLAPSGAPW
jgi:DNA-binding transcriptional ArsR family regulator